MVVGEASILIHADTRAFTGEVKTETATALAGVEKQAEISGAAAGANLRQGVRSQTGKLAADVEADATKAGEGMHRGLAGGVSNVAASLTGLHATGAKVFTGLAIGAGAAAAEGVHLAESMQTSEAAIASATGTSVASAKRIGDALLGTAGHAEFSGAKMAEAYATVAKQLQITEGRVLSAGQAQRFMTTAGDLATATQTDLGVATGALAQVMQGYHLQVDRAGQTSDVLYNASKALNIPITSLATAVVRLHGRLGELSPSLTDTSALMVALSGHGISGSRGIMIVNSAMQTLVGGSKKTNDVLKALGVQVFDSQGRFVGMRSVIEQLEPRLGGLNDKQRLLTAQMLFGKGAAQAMLGVIQSGPAAYDKATSAVSRQSAAHKAAEAQARTLHGELKVLEAMLSDVATAGGQILLPVLVKIGHGFASVSMFVVEHKTLLHGLEVLIAGGLTVAVGVFTVNKMAAFGRSFSNASGSVKNFASDVHTMVGRVIARFGEQDAAVQASAGKVRAAQASQTTAVTASSSTVQAENAAASRSFTLVGTSTTAAAGTVEAGVAAETAAVTTADTTIEAENAAAGRSFTALLGPIGVAVAAVVAAQGTINKLTGGGLSNDSTMPNTHGYGVDVAAGANRTGMHDSGTTPGGRVTASQVSHAVSSVGGLTPAQRKQLAALTSGATGGSSGGKSGGAGGSSTASHGFNLAQYNHLFSGTTKLSPAIVRKIAEAVGLPGLTFQQIAHGESSYEPGAIGHDPGGTTGYGLFQNTTGVNGPAFEKEVQKLGGWQQMLNPVKNAEAAKWLFDRGGLSHWYGTKYLTAAGRAAASHATVPAMGPPVYVNPLQHATGVVKGRVDQGVDYGFSGPLGALGAGVVESVKTFQGFGKTIIERLTGGPHKGQRIYYATETGATVAAHAGEHVRAGQQIAVGKGTGGIEFGFAGPNGLPVTRYGPGQSHDVPTRGGLAMASLLAQISTGAYAHSIASHAVNALTPDQKKLISTEKLVTGQQAAFDKWLAGQRATESLMTAAQRKALDQEIAVKKSALGIQTAREFAGTLTLTHQQQAALAKQTGDQKLASAMMTKLVTAAHSGSLKVLNSTLSLVHKAGFSSLVTRLSHDHTAGFAALVKQLVAVHKTALADQAKQAAKVPSPADIFKAAVLAGEPAAIAAQSQIATDTANAHVQAIQDATRVTLDQQGETGKTGADLVAAQAQTHLDQVTQAQNVLVGNAQLAVDRAAGGSDIAQAQAAADLATAQSNAAIAEAQAQAALDLDSAAASAADAAATSSDAATAASDTTPVTDPGLPPSVTGGATFNFTINGHQMTAADLMAEVGWALKTGSLPAAAAAAS